MASQRVDWGELVEKTLNFGREFKSAQYREMVAKDSNLSNFSRCSNVMIYAKTNSEFEGFQKTAAILMQMRNDGFIGFPGGTVAKGESPVNAINRKLKEGLNWSDDNGPVTERDHRFAHVDEKAKTVFHFYVKEVTESELARIEKNATEASDYGKTVLGNFRIPLYVMGDAFRGFPSFLKNHFYGYSKIQLIQSVTDLKLLTTEQVTQALYSAPNITK